MHANLTLKLEKNVIEEVKRYAREHGVSLSRLVEEFFKGLIRSRNEMPEPRGVVAELAGIIEGADLGDAKSAYADYLARKYS